MTLQHLQPMRLLPHWGHSGTVKPSIGGLSGATQGRDNLRSRESGNLILKTHRGTIPDEKKSAMQKIILAICPQCRHIKPMKMTENEKLVGIETMKTRIELFHGERLQRIGQEWKMEFYKTSEWSRSKVLKEFRELPENLEIPATNSADLYDPTNPPTPKTDAEMAEILNNSRVTLTIG